MKVCGLLIATVVCVVAAGCFSFGGDEYPEQRYYDLEVRRSGPELPRAPGTVLKVRLLKISRRYEGQEMVYRLGDGTWESDFYNAFLTNPSAMVTEEVQRWFLDAGIVQHMVVTGGAVEATHFLDGTVVALYGDYSDRGSPKAVMELQLFLVDDRGETPRILLRKESRKEVPLADDTAQELVEGWNKALEEILREFETEAARLVSSR